MPVRLLVFFSTGMVALVLCGCGGTSAGDAGSGGGVTLLNVSYDPTREFYVDFNA